MKRKSTEENTDDLRPEYDLAELFERCMRGKYVDRCREGNNVILLESDVAEAFPTDEAVNEALRLVIKLSKVPRSDTKVEARGPDCGE